METNKQDPGQGLLPGERVRLSPERARVSPPGQGCAEPQVILIRDGDVVRAIDVVCTCGKRTRLNCVF